MATGATCLVKPNILLVTPRSVSRRKYILSPNKLGLYRTRKISKLLKRLDRRCTSGELLTIEAVRRKYFCEHGIQPVKFCCLKLLTGAKSIFFEQWRHGPIMPHNFNYSSVFIAVTGTPGRSLVAEVAQLEPAATRLAM